MSCSSGIFSVNIKTKLVIAIDISFDQDRCIVIIDKFKITDSFRYHCIPWWFYIADTHGMRCTPGDLQFRIKNRIIKRRRYLTQTTSDTLYNLSVLIGTSCHISILFCVRKCGLFHWKFFSRHNNSSVDQLRCSPDVLHAVPPSGVCRIRAKLILQGFQICLFDCRLFRIQL